MTVTRTLIGLQQGFAVPFPDRRPVAVVRCYNGSDDPEGFTPGWDPETTELGVGLHPAAKIGIEDPAAALADYLSRGFIPYVYGRDWDDLVLGSNVIPQR